MMQNQPKTNPQMREMLHRAMLDILPQAAAFRHHLHQNPEVSGCEVQTAAYVAEQLAPLNLTTLATGLGGHGIVATLQGAQAGPTVALRADMDALPISEESDALYKSLNNGVMHACGHDGHSACLWGAAAVLGALREHVRGTIKFIFQPAEETTGGAEVLCGLGVMDSVDAIFALHGWPGMSVGQMGIRPGPMMASADRFDVVVRGRGGHAAYPHLAVDPIVCASQLVGALQAIASREVSPLEPVVVTVAQFNAGSAFNVIPGKAALAGTVRCLSSSVRAEMAGVLGRIVAGVCAAYGCEYELSYVPGPPVVVNDGALTEFVQGVGASVVGAGNMVLLDAPSLGAEDFAYYLERVPGAFLRLGVGEDAPPLHTATYDFGDDALPFGIEILAMLGLSFGGGRGTPPPSLPLSKGEEPG